MFCCNLVEVKSIYPPTNKNFKKFQNLSEETLSRVAENLIELYFVATIVKYASYSFE